MAVQLLLGQTPSTNQFWTVLLCTGFQPETSADGDPAEGIVGGITAIGSNECLVYYEASEETSANGTSRNAAHEMGHAGRGGGHCSAGTCIMDTDASKDYFCSDCLDELRRLPTY